MCLDCGCMEPDNRHGDARHIVVGAGALHATDEVIQAAELLGAAGAEVTWAVEDTARPLGACRMGSGPETSVVDQWCGTWDVPNLFVCHGRCAEDFRGQG